MRPQLRATHRNLRPSALWLLPSVLLLFSLAACTASSPATNSGLSLSDAPLSGKFVWHDLITDNPTVAQQFYGSLFGWSFEKASGLGEPDYTLIRNQGRFVGGIVQLADPTDADYSRWLPYLSVNDVDKAVEQTLDAGGRSIVAPRDIADLARAAAVLDPQNAVVGLVRSKRGDPDDSHTAVNGDIVWNEFLAADADTALGFYSQLANYSSASREDDGRKRILLKSQGHNRASIMTRPNDEVAPVWVTHIAVGDVGSSARRAAELGGTVVLAPDSGIRDGRLALITDPTGALLALHQWPEQSRSEQIKPKQGRPE